VDRHRLVKMVNDPQSSAAALIRTSGNSGTRFRQAGLREPVAGLREPVAGLRDPVRWAEGASSL
jgi:hypothetical protein